jgi:hypothetical protein
MAWRNATLTLQPTAEGLAGRLDAGDDCTLEIRHWRKHEGGRITLQIDVDDPSWQAFLSRQYAMVRV